MGFGDRDDAGRKRKATTLVDDAAMEDDDVEDDEEPSRTPYNRRVVRFIEDEVAVDEHVEEDDEDVELFDEEPLHDVDADERPSRYRSLDAGRDAHEDVEQLAELIRQRYETEDYAVDAATDNQQSLVPTHLDPKLWMVQCRPGFERTLCLQMMNKYRSCRSKGAPLLIKSAISQDHLKGYFYVEAEKESHVSTALAGMRHVFHTKGVKVVPLKEMVSAITPNRVAKMPIEIGSWVRVRSGPYAHDLARVLHVNHQNQKVEVKVVPRIDYSDLLSRQEGRYLKRNRDPFGTKPKIRPIAKPFNSEECRGLGLAVERRRGPNHEVYMSVGNYIFQDGYLIKKLATRSVVVEENSPSFEEIRMFENAAKAPTEKDGSAGLLPDVKETPTSRHHGLFKGDSVRVQAGDMMNMTGTVTDMTMDGKILSVKMDSSDVKKTLPFEAENLAKRFDLGDHVRVREGMHAGQMGMVIKIESHRCLILSDLDKTEFWAAARDLSRTEQSSFGHDQFGIYDLEDVVELHNQQFGVIVFADREFCTVLLAAGNPETPELKRTTQQQIKSKCQDAKRNTVSDMYRNRLSVGDIVDFRMGVKGTANGTVKFVVQSYVFVKIPNRTENLGYVAVSCKLCAVRGGQRPKPEAEKSFSGLQSPAQHPSASWRDTAENVGGRYSDGRYSVRGSGRGYRGHRESIMVKVIKGAHRGYRGRIKDETRTHARVELDAGSRIITIPKEHVECLDVDQGMYGASADNAWNWGETDEEQAAPAGPPKTPFGEGHPPMTPYMTGGRDMTSPSYLPVQTSSPPQAESAAQDQSDSDDDFCFGPAKPTQPPPSAEKPKSPAPAASPQKEMSEEPPTDARAPDLTSVGDAQIKDLIVALDDGTFGVTREVLEDGTCRIEAVTLTQGTEERSFSVLGDTHHRSKASLIRIKPEKGDWIRVLEGMFEDSIGQMIAVDGTDCIIRLDDNQIQIFSSNTIAVTLNPNL